ncbi:hypothetical protein [Natronoglycomyces albus]|uniref:Heavy metal-binding domain-containing protein n=1 Tax=Natronoglycomyces albus TaxID=2811108 RepID=A0A895XN46_9ACTN|nr:hypothetical protein [Natronoglycomyces albus]QSB04465.1 hypothetical protein JQS30_11805 [Natronoglycomyces albus]
MRANARIGLIAAGAAVVVAGAVLITHLATGDDETDAGPGLAQSQDGFTFDSISAPEEVNVSGELSFTISGPDGSVVTEFEESHEKDLHLIAVHATGEEFRHVHPDMDAHGVWSVPWQWDQAGTYRLYADFVAAESGEGLTISRTFEVAGDVKDASERSPSNQATVGGLDITLSGDLGVGSDSMLTFDISRDGEPVAELEPYLGAYGHLVVLRESDLAYLHVHPMGESEQGVTSPDARVEFHAQAPTVDTYFLYLDFQVDGEVYTAEFTVEAEETIEADQEEDHSGH